MVIDTVENTLETRFMVLVSTTLLMVTVTKVRGTKARNKASECTHSATATQDQESGTLAFYRTLSPRWTLLFNDPCRYLCIRANELREAPAASASNFVHIGFALRSMHVCVRSVPV